MKEYKFNKVKHQHLLDGRELTGCTTVISVKAKPMLIQWASDVGAAMALEMDKVEGFFSEYQVVQEIEDWREKKKAKDELDKKYPQFRKARLAHSVRKKEAGDYGTKTHEEIENVVLNAIKNNNGVIAEHNVGESKSISNLVDWAIENKVKFLDSEKNIYSEMLWIGGIVDMMLEIDGQIWIGDIKTSKSGIYPENFWQCAGYHLMLKAMNLYPKIAGYLILNLKENGEMLEKRSISNEDNIKAFLSCLNIYRIQEKIKNQVL